MTDEKVRLEALGAAFPGAKIAPAPPVKLAPKPKDTRGVDVAELVGFRDALAEDAEYLVKHPADDDERCAAQDLSSQAVSEVRRLRFRLYELGTAAYVLLAQYRFEGIAAYPCFSVARLFVLSGPESGWRIAQIDTLPTYHHSAIQDLAILRPRPSGPKYFLVESDTSGAATQSTSLQILEWKAGHLAPVLTTVGRIADGLNVNVFLRAYDQAMTAAKGDDFLCFTKTTFAASGEWFQPPLATTECFFLRGTTQ